ncbi:MAG TPA: energy transducer TonB [Longimicrobium sp.]|jgi:TonB family protein
MNLTHPSARSACAVAVVAAAALFLAPSAGHAQSRAEQLLSDRPAPRQGCNVATTPGQLPALSQLADSAALAAAVAEFATRLPLREGNMFALYSVAFNASGAVERVKDLEYLLPQGKAAEFEELLRQHLRPQARGRSFSVRVRIEPGGNPVFRVGRSEICEPQLSARFRVSSPSLEGTRRPTPIRVRVVVAPDGTVTDTQLLRGSGSDGLDRWVLDALREFPFQPGLVDGVAVEMEREEVVRLNSRG